MRIFRLLPLALLGATLFAQQPTSPSPAAPASAPVTAPLPTLIDAPAGTHLLFELQGVGNQIYMCAVRGVTAAWQFKAPDAKLLDASGQPVGLHYAGPTWRLSDGSEVQGAAIGSKPSPNAGSIPWLLLRASVHDGTGKLNQAEFIRRTDTQGGSMPITGCDAHHAGTLARIPYTAKYSFYGK